MVRFSNSLVGILNFIVFLASLPVLGGGIWLKLSGKTQCEQFLNTPIIVLGIFLMIVSLVGLVGACCRVTWLLWIYLIVMFLLIVAVFGFTIFTFIVTNKGAGKVLSGIGFKEYILKDYSNWLQNHVTEEKNWSKIKSCLVKSKVCSRFEDGLQHIHTIDEFYKEHLSSIQSGCCKPPTECEFTYVSPTNWTKKLEQVSKEDCRIWDNAPEKLCFDCGSCKAGLLDNIKNAWKKIAIINSIVLVVLIIIYIFGCCALKNNRMDDYYKHYYFGGYRR